MTGTSGLLCGIIGTDDNRRASGIVIAMVLSSALILAPLHPRPAVPPVGAEVDQSYEIALPAAVDGPALAIAASGAKILIARPLLEQLAALDGPTWSTEEQRQEQIAAVRAKRLLAQAGPASPEPASALAAETLGDASYLIAQILEAGKAVVLPAGSAAPAGKIAVRYAATHPGPNFGFGRITFSLLPTGGEFFSVSWFAA